MPTLRSHTHLQATQVITQAKACKRVCLTNRTDTATWDRRKTPVKEGERITQVFAIARLGFLFGKCSEYLFSFFLLSKFSVYSLNPVLKRLKRHKFNERCGYLP